MAGSTGLEPAASAVTGQRSNQLNYDPAFVYIGLAETRVALANRPTARAGDIEAIVTRPFDCNRRERVIPYRAR